ATVEDPRRGSEGSRAGVALRLDASSLSRARSRGGPSPGAPGAPRKTVKLLREPLADALVRGLRLGRHLEVAQLEEGANLDLGLFRVGVRAALHPLDALGE